MRLSLRGALGSLHVSLLALAVAGCTPEPANAPLSPDAADGGDVGDVGDVSVTHDVGGDAGSIDASVDPRYRNRVDSDADFEALADQGRTLKFLVPKVGAERFPPFVEACYFQNMSMFSWHLDFIRSFEGMESLSAVELERRSGNAQSRRWWTGSVQRYPDVAHPESGLLGVSAFEVFSSGGFGAGLGLDEFVDFAGVLSACAPALAPELAFLPTSEAQIQWVGVFGAELDEAGISVILPEDLVAAQTLEILSEGVAYGELVVARDGELPSGLSAHHILIARYASVELTTVGGLVTESPQNPFSHLNLRMEDRGSPNVVAPEVFTEQLAPGGPLEALEGELVQLRAEGETFEIKAATWEEARAYWDATRPNLPAPSYDLEPRALMAYDELGVGDAAAYGAKAANLAELWNLLPPANRTDGFAIPISRYVEFMETTGIQRDVEALLDGPELSLEELDAALKAIRKAIRNARIDPDLLQEVEAQIITLVGADNADTTRIRFRSSSNVEDLADWSGAGLYDSKSGCLGDTDPDEAGPSACRSAQELAEIRARLAAAEAELEAHPERSWLEDIIEDLADDLVKRQPIEDAIVKVWRSLWTLRAFQEREYWGVDHRYAFMGIAVNVSFALEQRNAVAVTNIARTATTRTDRILTQFGEESVVDPDNPGALPEVLNLVHDLSSEAAFTSEVLANSTLADDARPLWTRAQLRELAGVLRLIHDHFAGVWSDPGAPLCLDIEIKLTAEGEVSIKQVRPYSACQADRP